MPVTLKDIGKVRDDLKNRRPSALPTDPNTPLTNRQAVHQLASTLFRLKKRGFKTKELVDMLKENDIKINAATLNRYLDESRNNQKATDVKPAETINPNKKMVDEKTADPSGPSTKPFGTTNPTTTLATIQEVKK